MVATKLKTILSRQIFQLKRQFLTDDGRRILLGSCGSGKIEEKAATLLMMINAHCPTIYLFYG